MCPSDELTASVKRAALEVGFARVGVAPAGPLPNADRFVRWLQRGWCGGMRYMRTNLPKRLRPDLLVPGARSVICLAVGYAPKPGAPGEGLVARYAHGRDYHKVLKRRCRRLIERLGELDAGFDGRAFVDSGPVMERSLAVRAGLGWIGRNGCLSVPGLGSYVLLCEIICNWQLVPDEPIPSQCNDCSACVNACPTGAIQDEAMIDARRCISYLTIECRGEIEREFWPLMGTRVFGCDRCQEVCPHNSDLPAGDAELLGDRPPLDGAEPVDILRWSPEDWDRATRGSGCRRATYEMFGRNAAIAAGNSREPALVAPLSELAERRPELAPIAQWAVERLRRQ